MGASSKSSILSEILRVKRDELAVKTSRVSLAEMRARAKDTPSVRGFRAALQRRIDAGVPAIIAEIKKASPSRGVIRADLDVAHTARQYEAGGAAALSVLTDQRYFQGDDTYIALARGATQLPVLRKEFIIDPWQVYETRVLGADCLLLIVSALEPTRLRELHALAVECGLDVLVEVHDQHELESAVAVNPSMVGINNRNLHGFETQLDVTRRLAPMVRGDRLVVAESGIHSAQDVRALGEIGVRAFLVGEALMRAEDSAALLEDMIGCPRPQSATTGLRHVALSVRKLEGLSGLLCESDGHEDRVAAGRVQRLPDGWQRQSRAASSVWRRIPGCRAAARSHRLSARFPAGC